MKSFVALLMVNVLAAFFLIAPGEINASTDQSKEVEQYIEILKGGIHFAPVGIA